MWRMLFAVTFLLTSSCSGPEPMRPPAKVSRDPAAPPPARLPFVYACDESEFPAYSGNRQYSGLYDRAFERSAFTLENSSCTVWLTGHLDEACKLVGGCQKGSKFVMRLTVSGELSPSYRYGHLGAYERELRVNRVLYAEVVSNDGLAR